MTLPDVNVLIALFDPVHPNHDDAHAWFGRARRLGWATCPVTINGCVRVLSNPSYPTVDARPAEVISKLQLLCGDEFHEFWPDAISLLDRQLFKPDFITGHQKITDAYLLALAFKRRAKLATFDRSIPVRAVQGATSDNLELLGS
jgi:toxin-antitoxin system PIN domain toxin